MSYLHRYKRSVVKRQTNEIINESNTADTSEPDNLLNLTEYELNCIDLLYAEDDIKDDYDFYYEDEFDYYDYHDDLDCYWLL